MFIDDKKLADVIINMERDISVLKKTLTFIMGNNSNLIYPTQDELNQFNTVAIIELQNKYPNLGIQSPSESNNQSPSDFDDD